ncbi:MAG: HD domain-containing protein [Spirochaetaceae bacterium]|nr:MAG: HD domain-containing protein [Spirochaetaceae bacterium]
MEIKGFLASLQKIHSQSNLPFVVFDSHYTILAVNPSFSRFFNMSVDDVGKKKLDFLTLNNREPVIPITTLSETQLSGFSGIVYCTREGLQYNFCASIFPLGKVKDDFYFYSVFKDSSEIEQNIIEKSLHALIKASLLKDNDTGNHIKRINAYSRLLSEYLFDTRRHLYTELNDFFINKISFVASMHDVGKIGTPDSILTKPGELTVNEFDIIKEHTINGAFILSSLAGEMARDIALFHHERWDGSGYPYKLKGNEIPLSARIVAIADVYDALRMKRHYKNAMSHAKAREIIEWKAGKHFDPEIVKVFLEIQNQFERIYNENADLNEEIGQLEELEEVL